MRKLTFVACVFASVAAFLCAQTIDKPAATVKLTKLQVIPASKANQQIGELEKRAGATYTAEQKRAVLNTLINEILINQAAARDLVTVAEEEVSERLALVKKTGGLFSQLNRELTDTELRSAVLQAYGMTLEEYRSELRKVMLMQKYVVQQKKSLFENIPSPTDEEVEEYYDENKTAFVSPDIVRLRHIFIDTRNLTNKDDREKASERAQQIYREYQNGGKFDDLVVKYSDDQASRYQGGEFGYLRRDDTARKQLLGKEFFDAPFKMKVNDVSEVLKSNIGYHIIRVTEYYPFQLLGLESTIPPQNATTVRENIRASLYQRVQTEVFNQASADVLAELRKQAEIKIFDDNLGF